MCLTKGPAPKDEDLRTWTKGPGLSKIESLPKLNTVDPGLVILHRIYHNKWNFNNINIHMFSCVLVF